MIGNTTMKYNFNLHIVILIFLSQFRNMKNNF